MPPTSAANTISYAQSTGLPISFRNWPASAPATTKPRPIIRPKVCSVMPKMWISGCMPE